MDTRVRHPEKAQKPDNPALKKPPWIRVKAPVSPEYHETRRLMRELQLNTVCEEAACPNIGECWKLGHATVMILGSVCTRACTFCNVATGKPDLLDPHEPERVGQAVARLKLAHIVVTSVDRDDLDDGGAAHFARTIGSMEYAVEHFATPLIVVLGHERCGAISAAVAAVASGVLPPPHIASVVTALQPAVLASKDMPGDAVENAITTHVRQTVAALKASGPILADAVERGRLEIIGAEYHLHSGGVSFLT